MNFSRGGGKYAFDPGAEPWYQTALLLRDNYKPFGTYQDGKDTKSYIAPWKLVPTGENDTVEAAIANSKVEKIDPANISFVLKDGTGVAARQAGDKWTLSLPSVKDGQTYEVYVLYKKGSNLLTVGKLNVVSYYTQKQTVTLVPVDGQAPDAGTLERNLNAIYAPYGVTFTVKVDNALAGNKEWDTDGDGKMNLSGSGFFSRETGEMKALRKLYQGTDGYDKNGYYLFVLGSANVAGEPDDADVAMGDMPRGQRFGYIFTGNGGVSAGASSGAGFGAGSGVSAGSLAWLAAHELGHGVFTLQHTFEPNYSGRDNKGKTTNLMDYSNSTGLAAFQWNVMAHPAIITGFDSDEAAMGVAAAGAKWMLDTKYTALLDYVCTNKLNPNNTANTAADTRDDWGKAWTYIDSNPQQSVDNVIKIVKNAVVGKTVPAISLSEKGIYIGKYTVSGTEYDVAVYSRKADIKNITKVSVSDLKDLETSDIKKNMFCGESAAPKYVVLAFYENSETEPALMIQATKTEQLKTETYLKGWMQYLGVMDKMLLFNGNERFYPNSFLLITADPLMPQIKVRPLSNKEVELQLKITYQRDVARLPIVDIQDTYPSDDSWQKIKMGEEWDIDFGQDTRGGTAELYCRSDGNIDTTRFYIRGTNPSETQIKTYMDSQGYRTSYWFIVRMTRAESSMLQFGAGTAYKTVKLTKTDTAPSGEPTYGPPHGFGLKQLDNWGPQANPRHATPQQIWNWKANIDGGVEVIESKRPEVNNARTADEEKIRRWNDANPDNKVSDNLHIGDEDTGKSTIQEGSVTFSANPTGTQKNIYDAVWIKMFNGGEGAAHIYYKVSPDTPTSKPKRRINRTDSSGRDYVGAVCGQGD